MTNNNNLTFIDAISVVSFLIALQNLELNISQDDLQTEAEHLDKAMREQIRQIHEHLEAQDIKIDKILKELKNDSRRDF